MVFDLDYTLWPFWVDTHVTPPFKPLSGSKAGTAAKDRYGQELSFYHGVPAVLAACWNRGIKLGAASRTCTPDLAIELLGLLSIDISPEDSKDKDKMRAKDMFANMQIYPGSKVRHMAKLQKALGVEYKDMLFFDDEARNRDTERELGVCFSLVRDGVDVGVIDEGVRRWRKARKLEGRKEDEGEGKVVEVQGKV